VICVPTRISRRNHRNAPACGDTVGWKIQREVILLLAWGPAILLQLAHPLVARGVADHSTFGSEPRGRIRRLQHTLDAMLGLAFGTEAEARAVLARINAIHDGVHGHLPEAAGTFPARTRYSAHDPALLTWVHATLLDMNLRVYERFVRPLSGEDKDRYCREASVIAQPLGIPEGRLPGTFDELVRYIQTMLTSGEIVVGDTARALAGEILCPPASRIVTPGIRFMRVAIIGLLPATIRDQYGFGWDAKQEAWLSLSARLVRTMLPMTPSILRHWPAARAARRLAGRRPIEHVPA
jgi:uncharacterized protein (DUF2236 family)